MTSSVDICNAALSHIGAEGQVTAIDPPDGSVEAGYCARFYPMARRQAIEQSAPRWAQVRAALAEVTNTSSVWLHAYAIPSDCLKPLRVLTVGDANVFLTTDQAFDWFRLDERNSAPFTTEGDVLRTNEPEVVLLYVKDVTDTSKYPPMFSAAVGMLLAGYLAGPIIKGRESINIGTGWTQAGQNALEAANLSDANASSERGSDYLPDSIRARG